MPVKVAGFYGERHFVNKSMSAFLCLVGESCWSIVLRAESGGVTWTFQSEWWLVWGPRWLWEAEQHWCNTPELRGQKDLALPLGSYLISCRSHGWTEPVLPFLYNGVTIYLKALFKRSEIMYTRCFKIITNLSFYYLPGSMLDSLICIISFDSHYCPKR